MGRSYGATQEDLSPAILPPEMLTSIGRLIRAFADIEDIITLYICNLAHVSEAGVMIMLGKTAISRRLEMAEYMAHMTGEAAIKLHKELFNSHFRDAMECRNAVAHGLLLGQTAEGRFAFLTTKTELPVGNAAVQLAITYDPKSIEVYAEESEKAVPLLEHHLKLKARREARLQRPLRPHRKSRIPKTKGAKQKPQPQP